MRAIILACLLAWALAGCATPGGNLESGASVMPPRQWLVYCHEHPDREECK